MIEIYIYVFIVKLKKIYELMYLILWGRYREQSELEVIEDELLVMLEVVGDEEVIWEQNVCIYVNIRVVMQFEWDEVKNVINICKYGIDFVDVMDMFNYFMLMLVDDWEDYGEECWIGVGWIQQFVGVVVYVECYEDIICIILV